MHRYKFKCHSKLGNQKYICESKIAGGVCIYRMDKFFQNSVLFVRIPENFLVMGLCVSEARERIEKVSCNGSRRGKKVKWQKQPIDRNRMIHTHTNTLSHWFNFNYGSSCDITMTSFNQILIANMGMIDTFACQTHFQTYYVRCKALQLNWITAATAIDIAEYFRSF